MAVYVNTNVSSLNGRRYLNNVQNQLTTTYQRLSSGMRINSAKDDAAGLQIADRLTTQINGLNQGNRNTNDGIALAQTIEGALDHDPNMLHKIRTLAVQSANGTNTKKKDSCEALKAEGTSLMTEITRIANQTKFGGKTVLVGATAGSIFNTAAQGATHTAGKLTLQVGANNKDEISFDVSNFRFSAILSAVDKTNKTAFTAANGLQLQTASGAKAVIDLMDKMISYVDNQRSGLGAIQNHSPALFNFYF